MDVGVFEAKTKLSELLRRVEAGEEITITKHGQAIAKLVPARERDLARAQEAAEALKAFSKGKRLDGLSIREMREEGRQKL